MLTQQERETIESGATCPQCGAWMPRCRCPRQGRPLAPEVRAALDRDQEEHLEMALANFGTDSRVHGLTCSEANLQSESSRMGCD